MLFPLNTYHSVTKVLSSDPLKVLSIQSPQFTGDDRVFKKLEKIFIKKIGLGPIFFVLNSR